MFGPAFAVPCDAVVADDRQWGESGKLGRVAGCHATAITHPLADVQPWDIFYLWRGKPFSEPRNLNIYYTCEYFRNDKLFRLWAFDAGLLPRDSGKYEHGLGRLVIFKKIVHYIIAPVAGWYFVFFSGFAFIPRFILSKLKIRRKTLAYPCNTAETCSILVHFINLYLF